MVHSAGIQDRDGGISLLATLLSGKFPFLAKLFGDKAYAGPVFHTRLADILPNLQTVASRIRYRSKSRRAGQQNRCNA
jgi:hypothetical protein